MAIAGRLKTNLWSRIASDPFRQSARSLTMTIPRPKTTPTDPDHVLDCEFVMEPYFQELAAKAEAAGWSAEVVTMALGGLAAARLEMLAANAETDAAIKRRREKN